MLHPRRTAAIALVAITGMLALTACFPQPPALPNAPAPAPSSVGADPGAPAATPSAAADPSESAPASQEPSAGELPFVVDDGAGDIWAFDVAEVVADPPLEHGAPEPGTFVVGIILNGEHREGTARFTTCFDILVTGSDGETYDYADTVQELTPVDDIFYLGAESSFERAVGAVQLPEGVDPVQVTLRSSYGHPEVEDIVFDLTS